MEKNVHEHLVVDIMKTGNMLENVISRLFKEFDLTHVQYNILRILRGAKSESLTVGELKKRILYSNSDVTRLLDRLEGKEIVARDFCDENRRRVYVRITDKGLQLLQTVTPKIAERLNQFYSCSIKAEEAVQFSALLEKIRQSTSQ